MKAEKCCCGIGSGKKLFLATESTKIEKFKSLRYVM
jgi:hypothetical protein